MSELLRILTQIDNGDEKALLCELPQEAINNLHIAPDGTVDLDALIQISKNLADRAAPDSVKAERAFEEYVDLMGLIFDSSRAVEVRSA